LQSELNELAADAHPTKIEETDRAAVNDGPSLLALLAVRWRTLAVEDVDLHLPGRASAVIHRRHVRSFVIGTATVRKGAMPVVCDQDGQRSNGRPQSVGTRSASH
jgi:hypothetical protein